VSGIEHGTVRILVALSATADTRVELELYRYLLGDAAPELVGLVVEDPALLAHAGSRLAREIVLSGVERRLDPEALERELRARSAAWRRALEAESARLGVRIALETVRDERRRALARAAERADALVVDSAALRDALAIWGALPPSAPLHTLVLTPGRVPAGGIIVVVDDDDLVAGDDSALAAALRLARRTGAPLTVLDVARADATARPQRRIGELRELGVRVESYVAIEGARIDARTLAMHAAHAGLLVLPPAASADPDLVAELAARLRGALMLRRGPRAGETRRDA